jgi:uncharacterized membrane protein YfcA
MDWIYTLSGLVVGFIVGVTGVGGGSLMTPLLVLFFGISPATAVGTDLLYASITKAGGAWVHGQRGNVNWRIVGWLALGSLPAAVLTASMLAVLHVDENRLSMLISTVLGVALILTAVAILFRESVRRFSQRRENTGHNLTPTQLNLVTVATGALLGVLVTISSVGAGAIGMVALLWLYPRLPSVTLVAVDIAHAVPLTAVAGLGHFYMGTVDFALLGSLLLGSLPGIYLGSHVSSIFPERFLRPALAVMLVLIGGRFVL